MPAVNVSQSQFQIIQDSKNIAIGYMLGLNFETSF